MKEFQGVFHTGEGDVLSFQYEIFRSTHCEMHLFQGKSLLRQLEQRPIKRLVGNRYGTTGRRFWACILYFCDNNPIGNSIRNFVGIRSCSNNQIVGIVEQYKLEQVLIAEMGKEGNIFKFFKYKFRKKLTNDNCSEESSRCNSNTAAEDWNRE